MDDAEAGGAAGVRAGRVVRVAGAAGDVARAGAPADRRAAGRRSAGGRGLAGAPPPLSPKRAARAAGDARRGRVTAVGAQASQDLELRAARVGSRRQRRVPALLPAGRRPYRGLLRITRRVVRETQRSVAAARRQLRRLPAAAQGQARRALTRLATMLPRVQQVVRQTRGRIVHGVTTGADKLVSLFEPSAQILRRGKLHRPTEFGALVKVQETEGGIVTEIAVVDGKNDAPLLVPAVEGHDRVFGRPPGLVAVDRGFYSTDGERRVWALGVRHAVIPKPGFRSRERIDHERQRWFRRGRAWRAGGEARIARLKHCFGMARSRYRGERGMVRTVYWAAIANNLAAIASRVG